MSELNIHCQICAASIKQNTSRLYELDYLCSKCMRYRRFSVVNTEYREAFVLRMYPRTVILRDLMLDGSIEISIVVSRDDMSFQTINCGDSLDVNELLLMSRKQLSEYISKLAILQ
jgi:hypothetical protein